MMMKLARFLAFYGSWVGSVYSPQTEQPILFSFLCLVPLLTLFFWGVKNPKAVLRAVVVVTLFGICIDSLIQATGYFWFPSTPTLPWPLIPIWYIPLWIGFAISMVDFEPVFRHRLWAAGLLGIFGGPCSYAAGEKLGAIQLTGPLWYLAVLWILIVPIICIIIRRSQPE